VDVQRGISLVSLAKLTLARAGLPAVLAYRLFNNGNAPDTVTIEVLAPAGWRASDRTVDVALPARGVAERTITVVPPPNVQGTTSLRLVTRSRGAVVADALLDVQVTSGQVTSSAIGPVLTTGVTTAAGPWAGLKTLQAVDMHGPVSDGLSIAARFSAGSRDGAASHAFSRTRMTNAPATVQLMAPEWRLDAGTIGASVSNLTGTNIVGRGASVAVRVPEWNATALAASPELGGRDATGALAGGRFEITPGGPWSLSTSLTRLRETRAASNRELDAWSLGAGRDEFLGGHVATEVARRRTDGGIGAGWSAAYTRRAQDESVDIRYMHAPGGTRAFARAANELAASGSKRLTSRLNLTASAWRTDDDGGGATLSSLSMEGWSLGGSFALQDDVHLSMAAYGSAFGATTLLGGFGSGERAANASIDVRHGFLSAQATATAASLLRRTSPADSSGLRTSAKRRARPFAGRWALPRID